MTEEQKEYVLKLRQTRGYPLHSLPHTVTEREYFHISAACYEHNSIIGVTPKRMHDFELDLIKAVLKDNDKITCYVVLPNHYHILIKPRDIKMTLKNIFKIHQKTGYYWNKEDGMKGRQVWFNALDSGIKSNSHFGATVNYIHNNPVKHGYVNKWQEWPFSSAKEFIDREGYDKTRLLWDKYDISEMCKWDI